MLAGQDSMEEVVKEVPEEEEEAVEEEAVEDDEEAEKDEEEKKNEWPVEFILRAINITNFICLESVTVLQRSTKYSNDCPTENSNILSFRQILSLHVLYWYQWNSK